MWTAHAGHGRDEGPRACRSATPGDGKTLTTDQAVRRWLVIAGHRSISPRRCTAIPAIGPLLGLLAFLWFCYLLYSTWKSPTKQGFHDVFANTMVVKATRAAG